MSKHTILFNTLAGLGAVLALAVVATLAFAGALALAPSLYPVTQAANAEAAAELAPISVVGEPAQQADDVLTAFETALIDVYQSALPSVVDIEVTQRFTTGTANRFGQADLFRLGEGSGFVWDQAGHIVTNYHVVEDVETVKVNFADGTSAEAQVIGTDPDADLAVLKSQPSGKRYHEHNLYPLPEIVGCSGTSAVTHICTTPRCAGSGRDSDSRVALC